MARGARNIGGLAAKFFDRLGALGRQVLDNLMVSGARAARRAARGARLGARLGARRGAARRGEALWPPWAAKFSTVSLFLVPCRRLDR